MRESSTTARAVTFFRALCDVDPLAEGLLTDGARRRLAFWRWMGRRGLSLNRISLSFIACIGARTRFIDRRIERAVQAGATQVVLVGAGFDTRALRLPGMASATVYRIDHPSTGAERARAMAKAGLVDRGVPIDLDLRAGDLSAALDGAGFDRARPSVFVWEGVSMYLAEPDVRETLARMSRVAGAGSRLLVDTWHSRWRGWRRRWEGVGHAILWWVGEPIRFRPTPEQFAALAREAGWGVRQHLCADAVPGEPVAADALDFFELERADAGGAGERG